MTKQEKIKQSVERINQFLMCLYRRTFNFSRAVRDFGNVPYASTLRVVLRNMKLLEPTSLGNYKWVADFPTPKMARDVYEECRKSYNKTAGILSQDDLYALYEKESDIVEISIQGLDKVQETASKVAGGEETTFILYKKIGTITVKPSITINYD